ncbi:MAG: type IV toxin-antitoxin system AbiEi family antitoxin domain-containing protein [Marmoricola sp.]
MTDELRSICDEHGIFLRREAIALGYDDRALHRAMKARQIHRVRHGAYVFGDQWQPLDETARHLLTARAVLRTAHSAMALSHTTALIAMGAPLWDLPLDDVHTTRLDGRAGRREAGVAQHRGRVLPGDVTEIADMPVTSAVRTALDMTRIVDVEHSLVSMDWLLHTKALDKPELRSRAAAMNLSPGTLATDLTIRLADGRLESVGESRSNYLFWRGGLPKAEPQYTVYDERGNLFARVDFAWAAYGVFLEFDGKVKYEKYRREGESVVDTILREKKREETICRLTGWRCIRIVWADLYKPEGTIAHIRGVLDGGPVHGQRIG